MEGALPHALGPEKAILSILMKDAPTFFSKFVENGMSADMFYLNSHVKIASAISEFSSKNQQVDLTALVQLFLDKGQLDEIGGAHTITEIFGYAPSDHMFDHFCDVVKCKHIARRIMILGMQMQEAECDNKEDIQASISAYESEMSGLSSLLHPSSSSSVKSAITSVIDKFKKIITSDDTSELFGLTTGFSRLDNMILGLRPQTLFVIGARPSVGKTSYMCNMINHICLVNKNPTLMFSCEMSKESIISKILYSAAKLSYHRITDREKARYIPTKSELIRIKAATEEISLAPLYIEDKGGISIEDLKATARRHHKQFGIKVIMVDYLQLVRSYTKQSLSSKESEVSEISSQLKSLAKELNIPIVVLSQFSRDAVGKSGESKPKMNHLRSSGSIEQDADMIGLLHRYDYEGKEGREGEAEINIAKNREGPTGIIGLQWDAELTTFKEAIPCVK